MFHTWATLTNIISKGGPCLKQVPVRHTNVLIADHTYNKCTKFRFLNTKNKANHANKIHTTS